MSHDVAMLRAKIRQSLERIGNTNGHAMPPSGSNIDPALHEFFVAAEMQAYAKTRFDAAKDAAIEAGVERGKIDELVTRVTKNMQGESAILADGELYQLSVNISKPAERLDQKALRSYMRVELGLDPDKVDAAFNACTTLASPAKTFKVMSR